MLLISPLLVVLADAQASDVDEQKKLEGTWSFVTAAGEPAKQAKRPATQVVFKGDTIAFVAEGTDRGVRGTYSIDPSKKPKTMDIAADYDGTKRVTLVIYELEGDSLKLCHFLGAKASKERPQQFEKDQQTVLGILRREKK
jgi:uncharacterized protein (TIGR03067 family)